MLAVLEQGPSLMAGVGTLATPATGPEATSAGTATDSLLPKLRLG
jgi:hypothetical protein